MIRKGRKGNQATALNHSDISRLDSHFSLKIQIPSSACLGLTPANCKANNDKDDESTGTCHCHRQWGRHYRGWSILSILGIVEACTDPTLAELIRPFHIRCIASCHVWKATSILATDDTTILCTAQLRH